MPEIREANPEALLLAYQKVGGMREDGGENPSTGLRVGDAVEAFFLHDSGGNRLTYCDYEGVYAADPGNPGYQAAWLAAVSSRLQRDGFDGVRMDDVNTFPGHWRWWSSWPPWVPASWPPIWPWPPTWA